MSWINDLDALASAGVIPFDAPAYIHGVQPRYVGNPPLEGISDQLPQIKQQPKKDEFNNSTTIHNPIWKKCLFAGLVTAGVIFGASKLKFVKKHLNIATLKSLPTKIKNGGINLWNKIKNLLPKKSTPTP